MYAGIVDEKYGLNNLVEGFIEADIPMQNCNIYGNGEYAEKLKQICKKKYKDSLFLVQKKILLL